MRKFGTVHLVGAGPGDPDLLTVRAARLLSCAQVVVFDRLVGAEILDMIAPQAQRINVGKQAGRHPFPQSQINELLISIARQGVDVVRLKGGDPFVFGRGGEEAEALASAGVVCKVVPGITAASGCAAALGLPLTHRGLAESVRLITGHRQENRMADLDFASLVDPQCTLVIYMGVTNLTYLCEGLLKAGLSRATPVAVIERGTTLRQRVLFSELGCLEAEVERWKPEPPSLLVIGRVVRLAQAHTLRAFSSEADPGSREENATKQSARAFLRFRETRKGLYPCEAAQ